MKEYKFRGWDVIGHKWVYGDLVHNQKVTRTGLEPRVMVGGYEVDPESVGLCIGWQDSFDKTAVYEGDIVRIGDKEIGEVVWDVYITCFAIRRGNTFSSFGSVADLKKIEVIGNVYQDKELLNDE